MNIAKISGVRFGSNDYYKDPMLDPRAFHRLRDSDKLNVLYYMLKDIRISQKEAEDVFTDNQSRTYHANKLSFQILADNSIVDERKVKLISDAFSSGVDKIIYPEETF